MTIPDARQELLALLRRAALLGSVGEVLEWDSAVNLPPKSFDLRAEQQALVAEQAHAAVSAPRIGELLDILEASDELGADPDLEAIVRLARKEYREATALPAAFVAEEAAAKVHGYDTWVRAKEQGSFALFAPVISTNMDLARRRAAYLGFANSPYDCALDACDRGTSVAAIAPLFEELARELGPLARQLANAPRAAKARALNASIGSIPVAAQREFLHRVLREIGFDFQHGRVDVTPHPFCSGTGEDTRLTVAYTEGRPVDSLFSALHEAGHGLYEQGIPSAHLGSALGSHAGMTVHESQSRIWENQVGRSKAFWRRFGKDWIALMPDFAASCLTDEELHLALHTVTPSLIRIDADEVTYNLHILLRFEIEQRLFAGTLEVDDVPAAWNDLSEQLLGIRPTNDREGALQDMHWSDGSFGYFPSYCLGNMMAAQLWAHVRRVHPGLEEDFARGDFTRLLGWLRTHVHARGATLSAMDLVQAATGEPLSPRYLVADLRERYACLQG